MLVFDGVVPSQVEPVYKVQIFLDSQKIFSTETKIVMLNFN